MQRKTVSNYLVHYSEYRSIEAKEYIEDGCGYPGQPIKGEGYSTNIEAYNWNKKYYKGASGICPFCKISMKVRINNSNGWETNKLWECIKCGWWELERKFEWGGVEGDVAYAAIHHEACVKRFSIEKSEAPTKALIDHLKSKPDIIYGIHKKKMEEVVQYVFSSFYNCKVEHCGKSHDGGIDLIMIDSDEPTLIQVKCRERKESVEPISQIRDFLGAMWIKQSRKGIFVTTADHYSNVSVKTINQMISKEILESFEMIDFERFVEMLHITKSPKEAVWEQLMNETFYLAK